MADFPPLALKSQQHRRLQKGHLWVYANEVDTDKTPLKGFAPGQLASFLSHRGESLGIGFVHPHALIAGRLLDRAVTAIDATWFGARLRRALELRQKLYAEPYYRLVHGEGDGLPGLVVDRYGDVVVVQWSAAGYELLRDALLEGLRQVLAPRGIVLKNNSSARELEELDSAVETLGEVPPALVLRENGCEFEVSATGGQKTGWFYDHRDNRARFAALARGGRALDVFSYCGGFGVQAAAAGAASVLCVDASDSALAAAAANAERNRVGERLTTARGRAADVMKDLGAAGDVFDAVSVDPPAFIKKRKDQAAGEAAYRHLTDLALKLVKPGGFLVSSSCSMPLSAERLLEICAASAHKAGRELQLLGRGSQAPDHPIHPAIPETEYLKALFFRVN